MIYTKTKPVTHITAPLHTHTHTHTQTHTHTHTLATGILLLVEEPLEILFVMVVGPAVALY
jgi:hypothetical protein